MNQAVPHLVNEVILRSIDVDRRLRYQSGEELLAALNGEELTEPLKVDKSEDPLNGEVPSLKPLKIEAVARRPKTPQFLTLLILGLAIVISGSYFFLSGAGLQGNMEAKPWVVVDEFSKVALHRTVALFEDIDHNMKRIIVNIKIIIV